MDPWASSDGPNFGTSGRWPMADWRFFFQLFIDFLLLRHFIQLLPKRANILMLNNNPNDIGSGCGTIGKALASCIKDAQFESSHRQFLYRQLYLKDKDDEKETGNDRIETNQSQLYSKLPKLFFGQSNKH